jgi:TonB family protein
MYAAFYHSPELPWAVPEEEQRRYRKILKRTLLIFLIFALALPFLPLPQITREQEEELPPRLAQLLVERQTPPPAPVVKQPEAAKPEPKKPEPKKPQPKKPEPKQATPKKIEPQKTIETARAKAERAGLLAFKDELADLRDNSVTTKLEKTSKLAKGPKPGPGPSGPGRASERAIITASAATGSGGINTARLSRDTGGGGLGGRGTTRVTSPVGGGGNGGGGGDLRRGGGGKASRALEEIRLVFDRNKGSIYTIYNRALRLDPTLQGKVVLKLTIAPSGQVIDCQIVSSELRAPELERKLLARIRQFNFGAKDVEVMVVTYPIDFLPS